MSQFTLKAHKWQQLMHLSYQSNQSLKGGLFIHIKNEDFYILDFKNYNSENENIEKMEIQIINSQIEVKLDIMGSFFNSFSNLQEAKPFKNKILEEREIPYLERQIQNYSNATKAFSFAASFFLKAISIIGESSN